MSEYFLVSIDFWNQTNPLYTEPHVGTIESAVWDLTSPDTLPPGIEPGEVDVIILVFVMSALHPDEWGRAISNIYKVCIYLSAVLRSDYNLPTGYSLAKFGRCLNLAVVFSSAIMDDMISRNWDSSLEDYWMIISISAATRLVFITLH